MEDLQKVIVQEIDDFYRRNLFNEYFRDDFKNFIKDLEKKYNCEIDRLSYEVKEWRMNK